MSKNSLDEQAAAYLVTWLRNRLERQPDGFWRELEPYGFDLYRDLLRDKLNLAPIDPTDRKIIDEKLPLLNAIWDLCTRGILRPGAVSYHSGPSIPVGSNYAVTSYGRQWLEQTTLLEAVPMEYGRFSQLLAQHSARFGDAYQLRAQEAVRCYEAHTYFACCAMCGAAAESILLSLAFARIGQQKALAEYQRPGGRHKIRNRLVGQARQDIKTRFDSYLELLNYWRDESAHGLARKIGEEESFTSLLLLLRFVQLANAEWDMFTNSN